MHIGKGKETRIWAKILLVINTNRLIYNLKLVECSRCFRSQS